MGLHGVDLNLLPALHALLAERNVTRAAERMSVVQSSMSFSLKKLRKHFDDDLLVPDGRHLVLTPLAETLIDPVAEAVTTAENVLTVSKRFEPASSTRSFNVVMSDYVTMVLFRTLMMNLAREAPQVRVNIYPMQPDFLDHLRSGHSDLVIMPTAMAEGMPWFPRQALFQDGFVLVGDRDNTNLAGKVDRELFAELPYLTYSGGHEMPSLIDAQLDSLGVARRVGASVQNFLSIPQVLRGTPMVSILQERLARLYEDSGNLRLLPPPVAVEPITEAMYWNPRNESDPAHAWLRSRILEVANAL